MSVAALILAAGRGTRFGEEPKLLASLEGKPLVRHAADAALASSARPVILVVGSRAAAVRAACSGVAVEVVLNSAFADGLSTSLRAGFAALPAQIEGALILLGDMPRIGAALLDRLVSAWGQAGRPPALVPTYGGRRGNPVLLSRVLAPEIAALSGDEGAGRLLRGRADVVEFPVDDEAVATDVDTPEALRRLGQASTTPSRIAP